MLGRLALMLGLIRPGQTNDSTSHRDSNGDSVKCIFSTNIGINVKKTDLEKLKGTKLSGNMKLAGIPDRFGKDAANMPDKREQRKRDQEAGLVPFAVKLHSDIIKQIHALADTQKKSLNDITAELLSKALAAKK